MAENKKSFWGFLWTSLWIIIFTSATIGSARFFIGGNIAVGKMVIKLNSDLTKICGGLILASNLLAVLTLLVLILREHYLDERPALKLSPLLISGVLLAIGDNYLIREVVKWKYYFSIAWVLHVILYLLYLYAEAFRPYRPIKMLAGVNA